jgi:LmbE family N-acetylglucosaminyl deacetylase
MVLGAIPQFVPSETIEVERPNRSKPHAGKVLAAIQAHADDIPFFCGGTVAKLVHEGYTAYLIQTTNDDKCGPTPSLGETVLSNEREVERMARALGFSATFNLGYRNHFLDGESVLELRCRLVYLIRRLKVDTILTFNPRVEGERNPDHWMTGQAAEAASWMAGMDKDYPEQLSDTIRPHTVRDLYFWVARHGQPCNRVVDIEAHIDQLVEAMSANKSQGPAGSSGSSLRKRLAAQGQRLPQLEENGADDESVDRAYIRLFLLRSFQELGQRHGVEYAEPFYYVRPGDASRINRDVDAFVTQHAVPLS